MIPDSGLLLEGHPLGLYNPPPYNKRQERRADCVTYRAGHCQPSSDSSSAKQNFISNAISSVSGAPVHSPVISAIAEAYGPTALVFSLGWITHVG